MGMAGIYKNDLRMVLGPRKIDLLNVNPIGT